MGRLKGLKEATTLADFAHWIGYKPSSLSYILYKHENADKYTEFTIPKKSGGQRTIKCPNEKLKHLQKKLATNLSLCFEEILKAHNHNNSLSHGFRKKHSIVTNAYKHRCKRYVFNIDLKDFFETINFGRVRGFFIRNSDFSLDLQVATIIAQIACYENSLPQGSPCSPVISNLIGHLIDIRMANAAKRSGCTYSRYADDLTFSTKNKNFPSSIAVKSDNDQNFWVISDQLNEKVNRLGFEVNHQKTSMRYHVSRQMTTGLVVNEKVNVRREYYKQVRTICHSLFKDGSFFYGNNFDHFQLDNNQNISDTRRLESVLSYIYSVKTSYEKLNKSEKVSSDVKKEAPTGIYKLYRQFLYYKNFYTNKMPLIITEGKTDVVYIKYAIRKLNQYYPLLISTVENNLVPKVKMHRWSETFTEVCSLAKGTSGQKNIIDLYEKNFAKFHNGGLEYPVIILIDNDSGSGKIFSRLKQNDRTKIFYHVTKNLYVVPTPISEEKKSTIIEDFFGADALEKELNGKTFNPIENTFDKSIHYSKTVFAESVVAKNYATIEFDKFRLILDRIVAVINDYDHRKLQSQTQQT